jgi:hypothetical protein
MWAFVNFHLPDRTSPVNNSESMQQQTFWSPSQWLLSIIEAMRRWKMKRSSITDFFSPKLKQNKGLVICPPLAPLFIQNGCGYPVFQALMHFNKFLWRRYRPLFCLSFGLKKSVILDRFIFHLLMASMINKSHCEVPKADKLLQNNHVCDKNFVFNEH